MRKYCVLIQILSVFYFSLGQVGRAENDAQNPSFQVSGRVRSLSMTRDYEEKGTGSNSTLGILIHAVYMPVDLFSLGATYIYAAEIYEANQSEMLCNDGFDLFNEAWVNIQVSDEAAITAGRYISNGEIFRKDDSRQKPRAVEGLQFQNPWLTVGHAFEMSNYLQTGNLWEFNNFNKVFKVEQESDGVSWVDTLLTPVENFELALYDAYAWEITNLVGARGQWSLSDTQNLLFYARFESGVGESKDHATETYGISFQQQWGGVTLEPGILSVHGDKMLFQETSTGFNHPLAKTMIVYTQPYNGGADTLFLKATTKVASTSIYVLGMYTHQAVTEFDGGELDLVIRQPLAYNFDIAVKAGVGYREYDKEADTTATDLRFFLTYQF